MPSERERIDHYRITRKLGQGGMGIVHAAHDERIDRQVAIKMILDAGADATARERFWREARAAAAVSHPHVCQLYEIGETEGQLYIVMELLEGQSLASRLEAGPLDVPATLTTVLSILGALDALHERAIGHRDLKPSNVFLTKSDVHRGDGQRCRDRDRCMPAWKRVHLNARVVEQHHVEAAKEETTLVHRTLRFEGPGWSRLNPGQHPVGPDPAISRAAQKRSACPRAPTR